MDLGFSLRLEFGVSRQFGLRLRDVLRIIMITRNLGLLARIPAVPSGLGFRTKELKVSMPRETLNPKPKPHTLNPSRPELWTPNP